MPIMEGGRWPGSEGFNGRYWVSFLRRKQRTEGASVAFSSAGVNGAGWSTSNMVIPRLILMWMGRGLGRSAESLTPHQKRSMKVASPASSRLSESTLGSEGLHFSCLVFGLFARDVGLALVLAAPVSFLLRVALIALSSILLHIPMSTMHLHHSTSVTIPQLSGAVSARCKCHPKHGHLRSLTKMSWKTLSIPYRRC